MANLYEWEADATQKFQSKGDATLTWLLLLAAAVLVVIALFNHNLMFKALVAAYVFLP